ncbi:MAG TPA: hypothetical protein VLV56_09600 [Burkholderiales bacterium]|nr:hypothetical protein [Burkholderiales bacterium]
MKSPFALTLLAAALAAAPALSRADESRWESMHVYTLSAGNPVAVVIPSEWTPLSVGSYLGDAPALRFRDAAGAEIAIPVAALERASADKRVFRPDLAKRVARNER